MNTNPEIQNQLENELLNYLAEFGFTYMRIKTGDKIPEGKWGKPEDRITVDEVMARIARGGNYGIVPPDGYFIIDFDSDEAYRRSIEKAPIIQESLTFKTPRGFHVVFAGEGIEQGSSHTHLGQGVDTRAGNKGYVVGPGSVREDGRYEYLSGDEILEAPESLCNLLQKTERLPVDEGKGTQPQAPETRPQAPVAPSSDGTEGKRSLTIMERGAASRKWWKALEAAQPGERNDTISRAACGLGSLYADADQEKRNEIFARLIEHADRLGDGDQAEIQQNRTTATNQWEKGSESPAIRNEKPDNSSDYRMVFPKFDSQEFEQALSDLNIHLRSNEGRQKIEFWIEDDGSWPIPQAFRFEVGKWFVPDRNTAETMMYLLNYYFGKERGQNVVGVTITKEKFWQWCAGIASKNAVNPFRDWIESCTTNPDLEGLTLENWLNPWLENRDSELNRWTARAIMVAIVQNVYGDSQPCRVIPVLRGEKGIGKTTLVSHLIPEEFRYHFGQFHVKRKSEMVGSIIGKYLCEFGELDGMNDTKASTFKEFIGNLMNTVRLVWEANYLDYRNQALIIGTSNPERNVPNDDALRSRLVFMNLRKGPDPKVYLPDLLFHLYALAREAYLAGERVDVIPDHFEPEQIQASEESVVINELMKDQINSADIRQLDDLFLLTDFVRVCGLNSGLGRKVQPGAQKAAIDRLKELGVGTRRDDKFQLNKTRYYIMSDEMKRIRAEQNAKWEYKKPCYGCNISKKGPNFSDLVKKK